VKLAVWLCAACLLTGSLPCAPRPSAGPRQLSGPYLGQTPPGDTATLFAPGVVSTRALEYALEVSPSGDEILFTRDVTVMLASRRPDGSWRGPVAAPFSGVHIDGESTLSPDGRAAYFMSRRPAPGARFPSNLWVSRKSGEAWLPPQRVTTLTHHRELHAPHVVADGTIYDDGVVRFRFVAGGHLPAETVTGAPVGRSPYVSADERFMIFAARTAGRGDHDLYVVFRQADGSWGPRIHMGDAVNSRFNEGNPFVSADGRYLFFSSSRSGNGDIYWMSASVMERLRRPRP